MTTTCQKCRGLLVAERHLDFYCRSVRWKCVNCGWSLTVHLNTDRCVVRTATYGAHKNSST